jgi:xanthine dehydrogenase YagT iron-sulfur-binding subunit
VSQTKDPTLIESNAKSRRGGFSRRGFIQGAGVTGAVVPALTTETAQAQTAAGPQPIGPGPVNITLTINGKSMMAVAEPRETLLDVLRNHLNLTGAKRVCDRGTCGACTVIMDGKAVYACSILAIDARGAKITTIEGFAMEGGKPHPMVEAFVNNDAQQCGYCTPGFVVAAKDYLDHHPAPTVDQVKEGLGGNLCRCGTYMGIRKAVVEASRKMRPVAAVKGGSNG